MTPSSGKLYLVIWVLVCSLTERRRLFTLFQDKIHHELIPVCLIQIQNKRFLCNLICLKSLSPFSQTVCPNSHHNFSTHQPQNDSTTTNNLITEHILRYFYCSSVCLYGVSQMDVQNTVLKSFEIVPVCVILPLTGFTGTIISFYLELLGMALLFDFVWKLCITITMTPTGYTGSLFHLTNNF